MSTPPTITNKNLPPPQQATAHPSIQPPLEKELSYQDIVAKPLRPPNFMNLKPKNPNMSLFFGNRAVGEKESGMRFDQLITMGFRAAVPSEVLTMDGKAVPPSIIRDGRIMFGDLILLIIPKADYIGSQKWNEQTARLRVKKPGVSIEGDTQAADGRISPTAVLDNVVNRSRGKVASYIPQLAEVDSKTADNSGPVNLAEK
jgi:hypothetical protein